MDPDAADTPGTTLMYGRSLIADPWGTVLDSCELEGDGFAIAELSREHIEDVRDRIPLRTDARDVT